MNFLDLPYTLFAEIISLVPATDAIRCQRLNTQAREALTRHDLCISLILTHFPRSLEGRLLRNHITSDNHDILESRDWTETFTRLTRRYTHLSTATPRRTLKLEKLKYTNRICGVTPWLRFLKLDDKTASFHYWERHWTFDARAGLLVYPAPEDLGYQARDVETGEQVAVPFNMQEKVVRRIRLSHGVLIIEWCEETGHHTLSDLEEAHRHFATAFDLRRRGEWDGALPMKKKGALSLWDIQFRSEWKISDLGIPLNQHDRIYSAHNATHYVVYIWQPSRPPRTEHDPSESLTIWKLGDPSPYRPSLDPGGRHRPEVDSGPDVIRKFIDADLDVYDIRQGNTPSSRRLYIDDCTWDEHSSSPCGHVFFHQEQHRWSTGPQSNRNRPRLHTVKSTGIPISGDGPRWVDDCGDKEPNMSFCWRGPRPGKNDEGQAEEELWPGRAPCWRHDDFPYLTVSEAYDPLAGVRFTARHCFMLETLSVLVKPKLRVAGVGWGESVGGQGEGPEGDEVQFGDEWWCELMGKGYICGDERCVVGEDEEGDITVLQF